MPRPVKCRRVCDFPKIQDFGPLFISEEAEGICMTVDEYETIRLMDREGLSQEQCAERMEVARTTVQKVYESARRKLAFMLTEGMRLHIEGGQFRLCDGASCGFGYSDCYKYRLSRSFDKKEGEHIMRIAVTYEDGQIFQHFGHTEQFKLYDVEDGAVVRSEIIGTNGTGHGALAGMLQALGVDVLICGGIGGGARAALDGAGIKLYGGAAGPADAAVEALLSGSLSFDPNAACDHHGHHHGEGHECGHGDHECGHHGDHECGGRGHGCGHHAEG